MKERLSLREGKLGKVLSLSLLIAGASATLAVAEGVVGSGSDPSSASTEEIAKKAQNPIADMISIPFQNNTNFRQGHYNKTGNLLYIQPVIPFNLSENWNLITRTVIPVVSQVRLSPTQGPEFGLGDINPQFYFAPSKPTPFLSGHVLAGLGATFLLPTSSDNTLGAKRWAAGVTGAGVYMQGPWVVGLLASNLWSVGPRNDHPNVRQLTAQYFVNYNLKDGWYIASSPVITANWTARRSDRWTVPFGGGFGRVFKVGDQPLNASVQAFYNAVRPKGAPAWQLRFQLTFLFPTK